MPVILIAETHVGKNDTSARYALRQLDPEPRLTPLELLDDVSWFRGVLLVPLHRVRHLPSGADPDRLRWQHGDEIAHHLIDSVEEQHGRARGVVLARGAGRVAS